MIGIILKKEMRSFFLSPFSYLIMGIFSLIVGWIFFNLLVAYVESLQATAQGVQSHLQFVNAVVIKLFGNINFILMLICPMITMGMFSQEKKETTIDFYFSSPVKDWQLVIAKFLTAATISLILLFCTLIFPLILLKVQMHDLSFMIFGYLGLYLNLLCYMSVGLFFSSLTESQMIAALTTFCFIMAIWLVSWIIQISDNYYIISLVKQITLTTHFEDFVKGFVHIKSIAFYFSFIFAFLLLCKKSIESRGW